MVLGYDPSSYVVMSDAESRHKISYEIARYPRKKTVQRETDSKV